MPILRNKVEAGQFDGTDGAGLFQPKTGSDKIQIRINGLYFHVDPTAGSSDISISLEDPQDPLNKTLLVANGAVSDLYVLNGFLLPTESITAWALKVETTTLGGDAWLTIDYDFQPTEGI